MLAEKLRLLYNVYCYNALGGDLDSTGMTKPKVHAEYSSSLVKKIGKNLVANDNNYALAA